MNLLRIGHSPDPDDAFMFYALAAGRVIIEGYEVEQGGRLITVFSAPNYCGIGNRAAFLHVPSEEFDQSRAPFLRIVYTVFVRLSEDPPHVGGGGVSNI